LLNLVDRVLGLKVLQAIAQQDGMLGAIRERYFFTGQANIFTVFNIINLRYLYCGRLDGLGSILDFGCGYGRVTRWFCAAFPDARIFVTDINRQGAEWCAAHLPCTAIDPEPLAGNFDLIWVGSVFTHLPTLRAEALLERLLAALRPDGVLALTIHGRAVGFRMEGYDWQNDRNPRLHFGLSRERFEQMMEDYRHTGYGYADYSGQVDYGMCVASPSWYEERVLRSKEFVQILFQERADNAQDVLAFMRAGFKLTAWRSLFGSDKADAFSDLHPSKVP
jgi:SAM-dependent methyltransferase